MVKLIDILTYVGIGVRPIKEGEAVLDAEHITLCGKLPNGQVIAHCMQSSQMSAKPHQIKLVLTNECKNWVCSCTCKAGAGGKCKHIIAALLYINRYTEIPELSCTDVEQSWAKPKHKGVLEVLPLEDFCHISSMTTPELSTELKDQFFQKCIEVFQL